MRKPVIALVVLLTCAARSWAGLPEGLAALGRDDYETALREFSALADQGDARAMVTIGLWYYEGAGFSRDYSKAMTWFIRAFERGNGDAYNNLGVMYRDGLGVKQDRSVSYALFLVAHLRGLGSEDTQYRANRNLRREVDQTSDEVRALALCITEAYLSAVVSARGALDTVPRELLPSVGRPRIRDDKELWLGSEQGDLQFRCPAPWD